MFVRAEAGNLCSPCSSSLVFPGPVLELEAKCPDWACLPSPSGDLLTGKGHSQGQLGWAGHWRGCKDRWEVLGGDHEGVTVYVGGGTGGCWGRSA